MKYKEIATYMALLLTAGCGGTPMTVDLDQVENVPQERWDFLAQKKMYFGHQSVGRNIIDGMNGIMDAVPSIELSVVETSSPTDFERPLFAHSGIGKNGDPMAKIDHFRRIMEAGVGEQVDIAFLKLCYVDITKDTDLDSVFRHYVDVMSHLGARYPEVKFLHTTVPLQESPASIKNAIKRLLGRPLIRQENNANRHAYNDMIRAYYGGGGAKDDAKDDDVFDIAKFESTHRNGEREYFELRGRQYPSLVPLYSQDGGHLSDVGKQVLGSRLLVFLQSKAMPDERRDNDKRE